MSCFTQRVLPISYPYNIHTHQHHHNNHYQVYDFLSKAGVSHLTLQVHLSQHQLFWFITSNLSSWIISFSSCIQHCRLNNSCFRKSSPPSTVLEWSLDWSPFHSLQPGSSGSSTFNNGTRAWWKSHDSDSSTRFYCVAAMSFAFGCSACAYSGDIINTLRWEYSVISTVFR